MKRMTIGLAVAALAFAVAAPAQAAPVAHAAKKCNKAKRKRLHKRPCPKVKSVLVPVPGPGGAPGTPGTPGNPGSPGTPGNPAQTKVTALPTQGFGATNASLELTADGVEYGPYGDGGSAGGSLCYSGLNGQPLSAIVKQVYQARYTSDGDTGGVGVPYLRVFLNGDSDDAIFSPNTQPPDPDVSEGPFHIWDATAGVWRYDDDSGSGGPGTYGVNGAPYGTLQADHGTETISDICITTGFTAGVNLEALLREWQINSTNYSFGS
jgi:hypothetical protein